MIHSFPFLICPIFSKTGICKNDEAPCNTLCAKLFVSPFGEPDDDDSDRTGFALFFVSNMFTANLNSTLNASQNVI